MGKNKKVNCSRDWPNWIYWVYEIWDLAIQTISTDIIDCKIFPRERNSVPSTVYIQTLVVYMNLSSGERQHPTTELYGRIQNTSVISADFCIKVLCLWEWGAWVWQHVSRKTRRDWFRRTTKDDQEIVYLIYWICCLTVNIDQYRVWLSQWCCSLHQFTLGSVALYYVYLR